jgi:hypothetical protein
MRKHKPHDHVGSHLVGVEMRFHHLELFLCVIQTIDLLRQECHGVRSRKQLGQRRMNPSNGIVPEARFGYAKSG